MNNVTKLIFVDCLEITFTGVISSDGNYTLNRKQQISNDCFIIYRKGNRYYKFIADVYMSGISIGEIRFIPRHSYKNNHPIYFKFNNQILYQSNFTNYIDKLCKIFNIKYQYISLLDIAVDCISHTLIDFTNNYLIQTRRRKKYSVRHKGKVQRKSISTDIDGMIKWGNIRSNKYIKIYNKTNELQQCKTDKSYINQCWQDNGLNYTGETVERFELTLKQTHAKNIIYNRLCDSNYLASILATHCKNYFEFEKTISNHDKKWKRNVTPIRFDEFSTELLTKTKPLVVQATRNERITLKNLYFNMAQALYIDLYMPEEFDEKFNPEIISNYKKWNETINDHLFLHPTLIQYYKEKQKYWAKEFIQKNEIVNGTIQFDDFVGELERLNLSQNYATHVKSQNEIKKQITSSYRKTNKQLIKLDALRIEVKKTGN
ncbi:hypothetical protein [Draconibacterium mangrovi]|uniref:hypothetical protein n=1 Tax=Draconibacterium mangrovi TaxID=2697469 RepID=UPI0013D6AD3F|nr:hypothetical protein [Draconibacterium mangrovi]